MGIIPRKSSHFRDVKAVTSGPVIAIGLYGVVRNQALKVGLYWIRLTNIGDAFLKVSPPRWAGFYLVQILVKYLDFLSWMFVSPAFRIVFVA